MMKELEKLMEENKDVLIRLKNGTPKPFGHIHCPVNAWDCPYFGKQDICTMYPDSDPYEECDDFYFFWSQDWSGVGDYICYEKH